MSADEGKTPKKEEGTQPPEPLESSVPAEPDDDERTMFVPVPDASESDAAPEDSTVLASDLPVSEQGEGGVETAGPEASEVDDVDRTKIVSASSEAAQADADDKTQFIDSNKEVADGPEGASEADDRTLLARSAEGPPESARVQSGNAPSLESTRPPGTLDQETQQAIEQKAVREASVPPIPQPTATAMAAGAAISTTGIGIGTLINNNYEIRQVLKSGGMGEVYRGVEIGTGDPVAIKAILPELAEDEKAGLLFKREARTLRQLQDESIVRYYNYVHDRDLDRYFLVMEFVEGVPLSDHIEKNGAMPPQAALALLKRLAKGLAKAHEQDVIHRDLSPDNVMLPEGDVTKACLIDFGIAKSNVVKESTMRGQFAGKFKYVAPEQLGHFDGEIGPGTDVYGLGLLICAAAMGRPLNMGSSIVEAVQSRQSIPSLGGLPAGLIPIVSHMLEPNPKHRPASMDEVRSMLENPGLIPLQYRDGLPPPPAIELTGRGPMPTLPPVTQPPPGLQVPTARFGHTTTRTTIPALDPQPEPRNWGAGLATLLVLLGLGGGGWYAWDSGLLGRLMSQPAETGQTEEVIAGIPEPDASTRAGFLAAMDTGPCTYTTRVAAGSNAGMIEGFSSTGEEFSGLPVAYEEKFGARPAILAREISVDQCAALDFARALQGRDHPPVTFQMFSDVVQSGEEISGQIRTAGEQAIWAVLVAPNGGVYNLSQQVSNPVNWQRSMRFAMNLEAGAQAVPQVLLVVSSDKPLTLAATAEPGALAAELLPLVLDEVARTGGKASASLAYVLLTPPAN